MLERTESNSTPKRGRRSLAVTGSNLDIERQATKHIFRASVADTDPNPEDPDPSKNLDSYCIQCFVPSF
jgi:hypothetical protein